MRVLALDFDGVISDSAREAFVVALRAYTALRPESPGISASLARSSPDGGSVDSEGLADDPLYRRFVELMPLGNRAEDYAVVLSCCERGAEVPDQASYDRERRAEDAAFLDAFHVRFYEERTAFSGRDPAGWRRLLGPYPALLEVLRRRARDVQLAVATAKDRRSVELLLRDYGIAALFPPERVVDKEAGVSKRAHLEELRRRLDVEFPEVTFVDDKLNHLDDVSGLGVRCVLAAWGYNGLRERRQARERGHLVCEITEFERALFAHAPRER